MESRILQSVVEISNQRDLDSLEYSLIATMAELIPVTEMSVLKVVSGSKLDKLDMTECLTVMTDAQGNKDYAWSDGSQLITVDDEVKKVLESTAIDTRVSSKGLTQIIAPIAIDEKVVGAVNIKSNEDITGFMPVIEGFIKIYNNYLILFNESERDKLTGLYNRRTFDNKIKFLFQEKNSQRKRYLEIEKLPERRVHSPDKYIWMAIFDIDHFKRVNDKYGHIFGDEVLLTVSQITKKCFRNSDLAFRIGGEEFVVILEPATFKKAKELLENFRETIADHKFAQIGTVTISIGFAKISDKDFPPAILEFADKALYYAKEHGRNCIYNYEMLVLEGELAAPKQTGDVDLF